MTFSSARDFLEFVLRGEIVDETMLRGFLAAGDGVARESQFHDFKHADEFAKGSERAVTLRRYATGFANAEGGVLIGGVNNKRELAPISNATFGAGGASEWAERALNDLGSAFGVAPRVQSVRVGDGDDVVLLVAVDRGPDYIPLHEKGRRAYWMRMGTETREVPDFLMSDLVLGRRRRPLLTVDANDSCKVMMSTNTHTHELAVDFAFDVTNDSLTTARDVRVGMVGYLHSNEGPQPRLMSRALRSYLDIEDPGADFPWKLRDLAGDWGDESDGDGQWSITLAPFGFATVRLPAKFAPLAPTGFGPRTRYRPGLALYVTSDNGEPSWFQLEVDTVGYPMGNGETIELKPRVTRLIGCRPRVTIDLGTS